MLVRLSYKKIGKKIWHPSKALYNFFDQFTLGEAFPKRV